MNRVLMKDIKDMCIISIGGDEGFGIRLTLKPDAVLYPKDHSQGLFVVNGSIHRLTAKDWQGAHEHVEMLREHLLIEDVFMTKIQASRMAKQQQFDEVEDFVTSILVDFPVWKDPRLYAVKSA